MIRLIFHAGSQAGTEINTAAALVRLGRDPAANDLTIDDQMTSSRHCIIKRTLRGAYLLEDAGSTNGTFVNGERVRSVLLAAGDRFGIGATEIEVAESQPRLMVVAGPRAGMSVPIGDAAIGFGRAPDNDLVFDEVQVSAYHCHIECEPLGFVLRDRGSTNGTTVNGHAVSAHLLQDGDTIGLGSHEVRFLIDEPDEPVGVSGGELQTDHDDAAPARLVFVAGQHERATVALATDEVVVGRRPECQFVVEDLQVSGRHFSVLRSGAQFSLVDRGSSNGTFLNGTKLGPEPAPLSPGDLIAFGACVAEFRITGGVAMPSFAPGATMMSTVIAQGAYELRAKPVFVINGHVESAPRIEIGRSPQCAMRLDSDQVSRVHCEVAWADHGFYLADKSTYGTYLGDKRAVRDKLQTGHVIKVGPHLINVTVRGERCVLDEIDAATAMANIEVQRLTQFNLRDAVVDPAHIGGAVASAYKTVFKLDVPDADALVKERKAKFKQGAPAWRPSTDIKPNRMARAAIVGSLLGSVAVCGLLYASSIDAALLNHPLSASHASQAFADQAQQVGLASGCQSCHSVGAGVDDAKCTTCHEGFERGRESHHLSVSVPPDREVPGSDCARCHTEHNDTPRELPGGAPSLLGATDSCATGSCHPRQHSREFLGQGPPPPRVIAAGPVPSFNLSQEQLHARHALVEHDGEALGIGCTSCHATGDPAAGPLEPAAPGLSCLRCHEGGEAAAQSQCLSCHANEHGGIEFPRLPPASRLLARVSPRPSPGGSLLSGGALGLLAFVPLVGIGLLARVGRRKRTSELVQELQAMPVEVVKRIIHSINTDKCVGCHMCVSACPASVLELVNHKSTVVNFDACIQCRKCEQACAFDALRMHEADKPPPMIQMPDLDAHYQTPVEGMYLIGQASGTPQVKNAVNLGRAVVQHMSGRGGLTPGAGARVGAELDVLIVGSGPGGLSAAMSCAQLGFSYAVLEKQRSFAWTVRSYYHKGKEVMAEPNDVRTLGLLPHWDTDREQLLAAWDAKIREHRLRVEYQQDVTDVSKTGELFTIRCSDSKGQPARTWTAARVVLALGTMGNPRKLDCPGDDLDKVHNALVDPDEFIGKHVLVVGGTDSAIEVVLALCERNTVFMSMRNAKFDRVKPANLAKITKAIEAGRCTLLGATVVSEVTADTVTVEYRDDKRTQTLANDVVFAMIGGHPPIKWLQSVGVPYTEKPHSWSPARTDELVERTGS